MKRKRFLNFRIVKDMKEIANKNRTLPEQDKPDTEIQDKPLLGPFCKRLNPGESNCSRNPITWEQI